MFRRAINRTNFYILIPFLLAPPYTRYVDLEEYHAVDYKNDDASVVPPSESSEEKNKLDLGRVEVEKSHEEFNLIDLNKNGKIDLKEFSTYMSKMVNQHRQNFHEDVHTSYVHSEL